jgi:hypothetical protein
MMAILRNNEVLSRERYLMRNMRNKVPAVNNLDIKEGASPIINGFLTPLLSSSAQNKDC